MSDQLIVEREGLEKKDKGELQAIVSALGGTSSARMRKSDLIDQILDLSGASARATGDDGDATTEDADTGDTSVDVADDDSAAEVDDAAESGTTESDAGDTADSDTAEPDVDADDADASSHTDDRSEAQAKDQAKDDAPARRSRRRGAGGGDSSSDHPVGPDGEPLADWEVQVLEEGGGRSGNGQSKRGRDRGQRNGKAQGRDKNPRNEPKNQGKGDQQRGGDQNKGDQNKGDQNKNDQKGGENAKDRSGDDNGDDGDGDPNNRRSRRRSRGRGRDRDDAGNDAISNDPIEVEGYLDLRDEGYAFLRVNGFLPSRDDAYVSVKQVRQHGLRKGDHVTGLSRPANRNEKNPALQQIDTVNGKAPEESRGRPRFDKLTPVFPDERLQLEVTTSGVAEPLNMTTRIIDLLSPIGKGQRGLIVSPPKAGRTSIMKNIARAIETNNPEVELLVLLVDERPEEVTDIQRSLERGEVVASTFDRPPEEHTAVAELTLERVKRRVESGNDVVLIVDGITRLARAYNMSVNQSGRVLSGGVDAAALYPPKRFLGAARNIEEGGSLTILATALVETGSRMDEVIFEEFKDTANMELRLDRRLAERRIFPAIDVDGSSTRNEELLRSPEAVEASWELRKVIADMAGDDGGNPAAGIEMLVERLATFKTNEDFLADISKARSV